MPLTLQYTIKQVEDIVDPGISTTTEVVVEVLEELDDYTNTNNSLKSGDIKASAYAMLQIADSRNTQVDANVTLEELKVRH